MRFRAAAPSDVDEMVPLVNAAYRGVGGAKGWTSEEHLVEGMRIERDELLAMMSEAQTRFELAFMPEDAAMVGSVHLRREPDGSCYLGMLSVDPRRQAAGIGRALLARSEEIAREWSCSRMRIAVLAVRSELLSYYERRGYSRTGKIASFPQTARSHLKVPDVRMIELAKPL